ncbi:MAG: metallophosphoesterase family protein [Caldilineaceae bacterium]
MRIALISDIHGNLAAFKAVLADMESAGVDETVFLGDAIALGPQPKQVLELLQELNCPCVMGNHESYDLNLSEFLKGNHADWAKETIAWGVSQLSQADLAFVRSFPFTRQIALDPNDPQLKLFCFHGSPRSFHDLLLATTPAGELDNLLAGQIATVMACGHTHVQMLRRHRSLLLVNPGSVGSPLEEMPFTGEPRFLPWAEYAIVDAQPQRLRVELRQVAYDLVSAKAAALTSGLPYAQDWVQRWQNG